MALNASAISNQHRGNFLALILSATAAMLAPLQTFIFVYAFVGPLHYLTEIAWLRKKDFYFGGLDARRVLFSHGRNLTLAPKQDGPPVNLFIRAYVEVDGTPYMGFDRKLTFVSLPAQASPPALAAR